MKLKLISSIILSVFFLSFVTATFSCNDFTSKWNYCGLMNITGQNCDTFWQNASDCNIVNGNYPINMSNYITIEQFANYTVNGTGQNFTQALISALSSLNGTIQNGTLMINVTGYNVTMDYELITKNLNMTYLLLGMRDSGVFVVTGGAISTNSNPNYNNNGYQQTTTSSDPNSGTIIVMAIVLLAIIGIFCYVIVVINKKRQVPEPRGSVYPTSTYERHNINPPMQEISSDAIKRAIEGIEEEDKLKFAKDKENARVKGG